MAHQSLVERAEHELDEARAEGRRFVQEDRYVLVFALIIATLLAIAFLSEGIWGLVLTLGFLSATLLVTLGTSDAGPKTRRVAQIAIGIAILGVTMAELLQFSGLARLGVLLVMAVLGIVTPFVIARRLLRHTTVSVNTLAGAADIYLLLGLFYAVVYTFVGAVQAAGLDLTSAARAYSPAEAFFVASRAVTGTDFLYYSFVTLSTVGYGDLTSSSNLGRMLSTTEALFGQLYLVTVVAVIVTNIGSRRSETTRPARTRASREADGEDDRRS